MFTTRRRRGPGCFRDTTVSHYHSVWTGKSVTSNLAGILRPPASADPSAYCSAAVQSSFGVWIDLVDGHVSRPPSPSELPGAHGVRDRLIRAGSTSSESLTIDTLGSVPRDVDVEADSRTLTTTDSTPQRTCSAISRSATAGRTALQPAHEHDDDTQSGKSAWFPLNRPSREDKRENRCRSDGSTAHHSINRGGTCPGKPHQSDGPQRDRAAMGGRIDAVNLPATVRPTHPGGFRSDGRVHSRRCARPDPPWLPGHLR